MSVPRAATAVLLALLLTPLMATASAKDDEDLGTTCLRTRVLDGSALLTPVLSASGSVITFGAETLSGRYLVIVTPDKCLPAGTEFDRAGSDSVDKDGVPPIDTTPKPVLP